MRVLRFAIFLILLWVEAVAGTGTFVLEGDSITYGSINTEGYKLHQRLAALSFFNVMDVITNKANGGDAVADVVTEYPSQVEPFLTNGYSPHYLWIMIGVNDGVGEFADTNVFFAALTNYWYTARADGFKVIGSTLTIAHYTEAAYQGLTNMNAMIRSRTNQMDYFVDTGALFPDDQDATMYYETGVHLTDLAIGILATNINAVLEAGRTTWYVDVNATGLANGTSWANAWTNLQSAGEDVGGIQPGDAVEISGGLYTNRTGFYLEHGTADNWVTYRSSQETGHDSEVILKAQLSIKGYTALYGAKVSNYETNIGDNTYLVPLVTNNCNLFINKQDDPNTNQVAITVWSGPVTLKWLHVRGVGQSFDPGNMVIHYNGEATLTAENPMEIAYIWSDLSTGHGHLGLGGAASGIWRANNVHHSLFENHWADFCQWGSGVDFHHNIIRHRADLTWRGGCNDTFQVGSIHLGHFRIYNNLIEPLDNTVLYLGSCTLSNTYIYNNVWFPVAPAYMPTNSVDHQGKDNFQAVNRNTYDAETNDNHYISGIYYLNNTIDMSLHGADAFMVYYNRDMFDYGGGGTSKPMISVDDGMQIMNNLLLHFNTPGAYSSPLNLYGVTDPASDSWVGWVYTTNNMIVDYNVFYSEYLNACLGWASNTTRTLLTNAAHIAQYTGRSNNVSGVPVLLRDEANYDYRPVNAALNIGTNLTALTNLMPSLDTDIYGKARPATGAWTVGASQNDGMLLWLTFALDDGWTTNHVITDRSGWTNNAIYVGASTNHETWPTWTNGPNALPAAQFVVNWTNPPGGYRFGTYAAITNVLNGGLAVMTNGTWTLWAAMDTNHVSTDTADFFLSSGLDSNNWNFGKYYCDGPLFLHPTGWGGMEPWRAYVRWPNITNTNWQHYAITWDGTNWTPYLNGVVYTDTMSWTNDGNYAYATYTNQWTGELYGTNSVGGSYNWIGLGVLTHSGTFLPDDADGQPSNGQLWGRLADVRIYNRALTATEIEAIYELSGEEAEPAAPVTNRVYVTGTVRAGQVRPP